MTDPLVHLVPAREWELVSDAYVPASFAADGFVHLSAPHQARRVAHARFPGRDDLLLLVVDPAALDVEVVWEDLAGEGEDFPHVYAPVPRHAVLAVHAYPPDAAGRFPDPWEVAATIAAPDGRAVTAADVLTVVDLSRAGKELGRARLADLPPSLTLGDLLARRVGDEVAAYDADPGPVYVGLVQPHDAIRHSDGFRMRAPRQLDASAFVAAAQQAVTAGLLRALVGGEVVTELDAVIGVDELDEVTLVLERPVVAAP